MFERRVLVVLVVLVAAALALLARAAHVQIVQASLWRTLAADTMRRRALTETTRGRILDIKDRVLAADVPCNDAAVAYWFIKPDPDEDRLYRDVARKLARQQTPDYQNLSRDQQHELVLSFMPQARQQLEDMWNQLARTGGVTRGQIDDTRREIVQRVEKRRKHIILTRYQQAHDQHVQQDLSAWWRTWLLGEADAPPEVEDFDELIAEELQAHVVISNLSSEAYNELRKRADELPGLTLTASQTRHYPAGNAAAHVVGFLAPVKPEDLRNDPDLRDERRAYLQRDLAGADGLEKLAERTLRGARGRVDHDLETQQDIVAFKESPGQDLHTTIDIELQQALRYAFEHVTFRWSDEGDGRGKETDIYTAPGAAVVIDVRTGGILAMVSYPDFDPNSYAHDAMRLFDDELHEPLRNRATHSSAVPGSTIKPIIGLAAIEEGILGSRDTIQCDGYLYWGGKQLSYLRCWTASMFADMGMDGHQSGSDPHPTAGLNAGFEPPQGHLTLADALQRSCNVFFETLAQRVGEESLSKWMSNFGLGSATGCGLPEHEGMLLSDLPAKQRTDAEAMRSLIWLAGTGQGKVEATPLQMANVAATLARGGVVIRPTLSAQDTGRAVAQKKDLKLDPEGVEMVRRGMEAVVQTAGGTGHWVDASLPVPIAGKTGTAQAPALTIAQRDAQGNPMLDEKGRQRRIQHSTRDHPNALAPWYRRTNPVSDNQTPSQAHAWFIGYAPAENPKVAFAVLVEYGGSGGFSAASVVTQMMDALVRLEYIQRTRKRLPDTEEGQIRYEVEN